MRQINTTLEVIGDSLSEAHALGKSGDHPGKRFNRQAAAYGLVHELEKAGFVIVPKDLDEPVYGRDETRLSVGPGEAPLPSEPTASEAIPTDARPPIYDLTPDAHSVIEAFCTAVPLTQQAVTVMGDTVEVLIEAAPDLYFREAGGREVSVDRHAQAVRDVIRANQILAEAVAVLGHEAVDTLMRHLPDPVLRDAA